MTMRKLTRFLAGLLLASAAWTPARGQGAFDCAAEEMQLLFHYLKPGLEAAKARALACDGGKTMVARPGWLGEELPGMEERKVWDDPEEGSLSEAAVWRAPASILYELAQAFQNPPAAEAAGAGGAAPAGGAAAPAASPGRKELLDILWRYRVSLDRVHRSGLDASLRGRGRGLAADLDRLMEQLDALVDAEGGGEAFWKAARESSRLMRGAFARLFAPPGDGSEAGFRYAPRVRLAPGYRGVSLPVRGHQLAFVRRGDRVDVLVTFDALMADSRKEKVTATILQNVVVLNVSKPAALDGAGTLQMMLNPNEAQYAALSEKQGTVHVILRAEGDVEMRPMEMSSFRKLFR